MSFELRYSLNSQEVEQFKRRNVFKTYVFFPFIFAMVLALAFNSFMPDFVFLQIKSTLAANYPNILIIGDELVSRLTLFIFGLIFAYLIIFLLSIYKKRTAPNKALSNATQIKEPEEYQFIADQEGVSINENKTKMIFSWSTLDELELKTWKNFLMITVLVGRSKTFIHVPLRVLKEKQMTTKQVANIIKNLAPMNSTFLDLSNRFSQTYIITMP